MKTQLSKMVTCFDKFDEIIKAGDFVEVQKAGVFQVYKKDGFLCFTPYGKEERVKDYFSNDLVVVK